MTVQIGEKGRGERLEGEKTLLPIGNQNPYSQFVTSTYYERERERDEVVVASRRL